MADPSSPPDPSARSDWETYLRLLGWARPYRGRLALGIVFGILLGGSTFGALASFQGGVSRILGGSEVPLVSLLEERLAGIGDPAETGRLVTAAVLGLMVGFAFLRGIGDFSSKYLVEWVGHRVVMDLSNALFAHIQDLPLLTLGRSRTGELMSRTTNDTQQVERGVSTVLGDVVRQPFVLVAAVTMLLVVDARLAFVSLVLFPLCIVPVAIFGRKVRKASRAGQARLGELSAVQQETIAGSRIVKAFGMEEREKDRFRELAGSVFRRRLRVTRSRAAMAPIIELMSVMIGCVVLVYARSTDMSWDELFLFLGSMVVMYEPVKKLSRLHLGVQQASASADRIFEILDQPVSVREAPDASPFTGTVESIRFEQVVFAYNGEPVLRDIDLDIRAGERIALVGSSGAGKTTLVSLLPRFYDATGGRVLVNDADVRGFTLASLRRQIGIVTQETVLFNRTVAENIAYGSPGAGPEAIEAAARKAHAHEFILALEGGRGYDTMIGEQGGRLSGGQRQRLAIARALLRNPPILILDEATSSLDTESERHVQAALNVLMEGRTVFAIAHRLSTIQHADRIIVLEDGRIIEQGSHADLLAQGGAYKYFYDLQFRV